MEAENELSQIDRSVLLLVGEGAKNSEIADRTHYSLPWVKRRLGRLMRHFGARNRTELAIISNRLTEQPNVNETYRVSHVGGIVPVVAAVHGVQFQVTARDKTVTVKVRINPILAITANLPHNDDGARLLRLATVRRLRSYLQQGISLDTSLHELTIESQEELTSYSIRRIVISKTPAPPAASRHQLATQPTAPSSWKPAHATSHRLKCAATTYLPWLYKRWWRLATLLWGGS